MVVELDQEEEVGKKKWLTVSLETFIILATFRQSVGSDLRHVVHVLQQQVQDTAAKFRRRNNKTN